jgi:hypothetical protein
VAGGYSFTKKNTMGPMPWDTLRRHPPAASHLSPWQPRLNGFSNQKHQESSILWMSSMVADPNIMDQQV